MLKHLYLDVITWKALPKIFQYNPSIIYVLEERDKSISFLKWVLELLGKEIIFEEFFAGKLSNSLDDESVYIKAFKKTSELSLECSEIAMKKNALLSSLNEEYGRNTIKLHCTKYFQINLFNHVIKIETFKLLRQGRRGAKLLLNSPSVIDQNTITSFYPTLDISFYNGQLNSVKRFFHLLLKELYLRFKPYLTHKIKNTLIYKELNQGVLTIQEDSIRKDQSLRGHLHWADFSKKQKYPLHTISLNHGTSKVVEDEAALQENNIFIYRSNVFQEARKRTQLKKELETFNKDIIRLWKSLFDGRSSVDKLLSIKTIFLMYKARDLAQVCKYLNIKTYLIKETYFDYSDAIQLVSKQLDIKTLAYQYSNLGYFSPMMISSSDVFLNFSNSYNDIFKKEGLGPKSLKEMGYTSNGVQGRFQHKAEQLRETLLSKGVQFTIAYFDESNQNNRWGLIHSEEYKQHIVDLAQKVVDDPTMGVLVKTQFNANVIDKKFKDIPIVKQAIDTGRMLDIFAGAKRNDVYPAQVALAADICINDMIGAPAALEAVDAGKRCLLLNGYNYNTLHHEQYQKANIVYRDLGSALNAIDTHRKKLANGLKCDCGDWGKIKSYFLSDLQKSRINTIKEEVDLLLNSQ